VEYTKMVITPAVERALKRRKARNTASGPAL
jgi:hypothetical protein